MQDAIVRLIYQGQTDGATQAAKQIQRSIEQQREQLKLLGSEEIVRSRNAKVGLQEMILEERKRNYELNQTEKNLIALKRAEEGLARSRSAAQRGAMALDLRRQEVSAFGGTGLDRFSKQLFSSPLVQMVPGLGQFSGTLGMATEALSGAGLAAGLATTALGGGLVGAIALAKSALGQFSDQFSKATQAQTDAIFTTTEIVNAAGVSRDRARQLQSDFQRELVSRSGGLVDVGLGAKIGRNFLDDALKGAADQQAAIKTSARLASNLALIQGLRGGDAGQLQNVLTDVFSGSQTLDQLRGRDVLNDTGINKVLIPELQRMGVKSKLGEISTDKILSAFDVAVSKIADASRPELERTIAGNFGRWNNQLFGLEGVFSITRATSSGRSVFNELEQSSNLFFGKSGTLDQLASILGNTDFDVMEDLRQSIAGANSFLTELNTLLKSLAEMRKFVADLGFQAQKIPFTNQQATVGGLFNLSIDGVQRTLNPLPSLIGAGQAANQGGLMQALLNPLGSLAGLFGGLRASPRFAGDLSGFAPGQMPIADAIGMELANKPPGSELIIANDSELFIPRSQAGNIFGGNRTQVSIQNLNVYQQPGQDARSLALTLLDELDQLLIAKMEGAI